MADRRTAISNTIFWIVALPLALGFCVFVGQHDQQRRIQPGTPEHQAYLAQLVVECVRDAMANDLKRSRAELPVLPTRAEREATCRQATIENDRLYPEARPYRKRSD